MFQCMHFRKTGVLVVESSKSTVNDIAVFKAAMDKQNQPYKLLSNIEIRECYPQIHYSSDYTGILDASAGLLNADTCLDNLQA